MGQYSGACNLEKNILILHESLHIFDTTYHKSAESKKYQYHSSLCLKLPTVGILRFCFQQLNLGHGGVLSGHGPVFSLLSDVKQDCQFQ
ncbi:hypothetical protein HanRHA438_Chr05g0229081 [Helianthus annuus]|uniref:Uncharacterized protein n=1 Tax=Helianthus annuus TaxID=4232 RepID=A0A9K3NP63_HELAN|nr:hypothetical protein HanXRQr2_Chr05g0220131 [Helianthus annuus]KAJ0577503.1 hypothetical protein HanIR_Chr05g0236721 [Helianthus annuus]KAJ0919389.1 hypothetical protein HanRHA438_Chr05g0229081 [Helianthus annuus]